MDHLINNSDKPIPAPDQQGSTKPSEEDEDDDEGLKAHVKKMGGAEGSENALEAKVGIQADDTDARLPQILHWGFRSPHQTVYQM